MVNKLAGLRHANKYYRLANCVAQMDNRKLPKKRCTITLIIYIKLRPASWSSGQSLTTNHEVTGSIPGSTVGIFPEGEDSRSDHGLGRSVEFRFKAPPGTPSPYITTHIIGTT